MRQGKGVSSILYARCYYNCSCLTSQRVRHMLDLPAMLAHVALACPTSHRCPHHFQPPWPGYSRHVAARQRAAAAAVRHRRSCSQCLAALPSCFSPDRAACARQLLASSHGRQPAGWLPCATARALCCDTGDAEPRRQCFLQPRRRAGQAAKTAGLSADVRAGADRPAELRQVGCV